MLQQRHLKGLKPTAGMRPVPRWKTPRNGWFLGQNTKDAWEFIETHGEKTPMLLWIYGKTWLKKHQCCWDFMVKHGKQTPMLLGFYRKTWEKNNNVAVNLGKTPIHSWSLTPRPWKIDGWELGDKSFPFGSWVTFSGANFLVKLPLVGIYGIWWPESFQTLDGKQHSCNKNQQLSKPNLAPLPSLKL